MLKKSLIFLYIVVVAVMAAATFTEKSNGTRLYNEWWFSLLWALLTAVSITWYFKHRVRKLSATVLHLSFVVILLGALFTHLFSKQGIVHLRQGLPSAQYMTEDGKLHELPFTLRLDSFRIVYHEGTMAAADYESYLTLIDGHSEQKAIVSMNNICSNCGIRLYQSSYDDDSQGTVLALNSDPWGIPVTYLGYALLFLALIWILFDPKGAYRAVLRSPLLKRGALVIGFAFMTVGGSMATPRVFPKETAKKFGQLNILYNDRISPMQTYALDFTKKISGKRRYNGFSAEQVLTGFVFFPEDWSAEPIIKVKGSELRQTLNLESRATANDFFRHSGYILGPYIQKYYQGQQQNALYKQAAQVDDRLMLIMELQQGTPIKILPYTAHGKTTWYAPTDDVDTLTVPADDRLFMGTFFVLLYEEIMKENWTQVDKYIDKLLAYQQKNGGQSIPSPSRLKAEHIYNAFPFATILFMLCLTMGFITLVIFIYRIVKNHKGKNWFLNICYGVLAISFLALTFCEALRWLIRGTIPMSNGYETMLLMAWLIQLITLLLYRRFRILLTFGFLLSGFFLLVSHISQMDPQIGHLMPVLYSPLLTLHVSIIMMAFALLSLTFICGVTALIINLLSKDSKESIEALAMLSRLFLYPALTTLGLGIFIGAIWANVSWGNYWSWDPKETWALITFMVYAVAVHGQSLPIFKRPVPYHVYITLAFLTILMTYFGVNYILGGMHSYA